MHGSVAQIYFNTEISFYTLILCFMITIATLIQYKTIFYHRPVDEEIKNILQFLKLSINCIV